jgi:hypothetical protein
MKCDLSIRNTNWTFVHEDFQRESAVQPLSPFFSNMQLLNFSSKVSIEVRLNSSKSDSSAARVPALHADSSLSAQAKPAKGVEEANDAPNQGTWLDSLLKVVMATVVPS